MRRFIANPDGTLTPVPEEDQPQEVESFPSFKILEDGSLIRTSGGISLHELRQGQREYLEEERRKRKKPYDPLNHFGGR